LTTREPIVKLLDLFLGIHAITDVVWDVRQFFLYTIYFIHLLIINVHYQIFNNLYIYFLAYGFGLVKGSIVIYATLMNQTLQTAIIPVNKNELKFSSDIIWYMDNATLKK